MNEDLVAKALAVQFKPPGPKQRWTEEQIESLAIAWFQGEITIGQAGTALDRARQDVRSLLASSLRRAIERGDVELVERMKREN